VLFGLEGGCTEQVVKHFVVIDAALSQFNNLSRHVGTNYIFKLCFQVGLCFDELQVFVCFLGEVVEYRGFFFLVRGDLVNQALMLFC
jgi:hypothetical protein